MQRASKDSRLPETWHDRLAYISAEIAGNVNLSNSESRLQQQQQLGCPA